MMEQVTFETWAKDNHPWLLEEPTSDADRLAKLAACQAWIGATEQMRDRSAEACRRAARVYENRGKHSGIGWQVCVWLEREIRSLSLVDRPKPHPSSCERTEADCEAPSAGE